MSYTRKSFYTLEAFIWPGGGRKAHLYLLPSVESLQAAILSELSQEDAAYLFLYYGQNFWVTAYQNGLPVAELDATPFVEFDLPWRGRYRMLDADTSEPLFEISDDEDEILEALWGDDAKGFRAIFHWTEFAKLVPDITGPRVEVGDRALVLDHYFKQPTSISETDLNTFERDTTRGVEYGWNEMEQGMTWRDVGDDPLNPLTPEVMLAELV